MASADAPGFGLKGNSVSNARKKIAKTRKRLMILLGFYILPNYCHRSQFLMRKDSKTAILKNGKKNQEAFSLGLKLICDAPGKKSSIHLCPLAHATSNADSWKYVGWQCSVGDNARWRESPGIP